VRSKPASEGRSAPPVFGRKRLGLRASLSQENHAGWSAFPKKIAQFRLVRFSVRFSSRYSHVRMEAKRRALDEIAARRYAADDKRQKEAEREKQVAGASQPAVIQ
jgi:hypothetical protein